MQPNTRPMSADGVLWREGMRMWDSNGHCGTVTLVATEPGQWKREHAGDEMCQHGNHPDGYHSVVHCDGSRCRWWKGYAGRKNAKRASRGHWKRTGNGFLAWLNRSLGR